MSFRRIGGDGKRGFAERRAHYFLGLSVRNQLKRRDSDERIQEKARKGKAELKGNSRKFQQIQENTHNITLCIFI
jgi:hypothetical protein